MFAQGAASTALVRQSGFQTATFSTPQGTVGVVLPTFIQANDTISGTVYVAPNGNTKREREANAAVLNGAVVDVMGTKVPAGKVAFTALITASGAILLSTGGGSTSEIKIPTLPAQSIELPPMPKPIVPEVNQAGNPIVLSGEFSGNSGSPAVSFNKQPGQVIAKSPRQIIVAAPPNTLGSVTISVQAGAGPSVQSKCQFIGVKLDASHTNLLKGQTAEVRTVVSGLKGYSKPIIVNLTNPSPGTVRMEGGDTRSRTFQPAEWGSNDRVAFTTSVTAVTPGNFSIKASVASANVPGPGAMFAIYDPDRPLGLAGDENFNDLDKYTSRILLDTLRDLRARKLWDFTNKRLYQGNLKKMIKLVKAALRYRGVPVADNPIDDYEE